MLSSFSFDSLPEEICVEICSKIFADSTDPIKEITNLESVSKSFQRVCNNPFLLLHFPFKKSPFGVYLPHQKHGKFLQIYHKCLEARNPAVIYREGLIQYFRDNQPRGLDLLALAATKGVKEAEFFYGIVLLCEGGEGKKTGMDLLTNFVNPLVDNNIFWVSERDGRQWLEGEYWLWEMMVSCQPMVKHLKKCYVRDHCNCDGLKEGLADNSIPNSQWDRLIRSRTLFKLISYGSCPICVAHHILQLFFDLTEE